VFALNGPVNLTPGCAVALTQRESNTDLFEADHGSIVIRESGFYYVAITVDIPKNAQVDTTMQLELNNRTLLPPRLAVSTSGDCTTGNFAGHTVFAAEAGSVLKLDSQEYMNVHCSPAQQVFTLTLIRL